MKKHAGIAILLAILAAPVAADEDVSIVSIKRLPLSVALRIAQAAIAECQAKGIQAGVTVVDRDGTVQAKLRDAIAAPIVLEFSQAKAHTAAMFNVATANLKERANTPIGRMPGMLPWPGGLPIQVGGALLGAVGVAGAPLGETDAECAQAGIDAVQEDLEMAL